MAWVVIATRASSIPRLITRIYGFGRKHAFTLKSFGIEYHSREY